MGDVNAKDKYGYTSRLHWAFGHVDVVGSVVEEWGGCEYS